MNILCHALPFQVLSLVQILYWEILPHLQLHWHTGTGQWIRWVRALLYWKGQIMKTHQKGASCENGQQRTRTKKNHKISTSSYCVCVFFHILERSFLPFFADCCSFPLIFVPSFGQPAVAQLLASGLLVSELSASLSKWSNNILTTINQIKPVFKQPIKTTNKLNQTR